MNYGYIRVSTDKQTVENQRFEIIEYAKKHNIKIDQWINETISGTVSFQKRNLGLLLTRTKKGDLIICSELSRLGRNMFMIMNILNILIERGVFIYTVKENYVLSEDIQSKVLAFSFSISAEIERTLLSQRTSEALKRLKSEGKKLGRPVGKKNSHYKLTPYKNEIRFLLEQKVPKTEIIKKYKVSSATLYSFLKRNGLFNP
ncbi:MAG: master DNA invertase Mpi family serine-type recombinase [Treponema sp.]|nr:master DNA invertase Mpi family serine-type recombinase [Treponema sp.]